MEYETKLGHVFSMLSAGRRRLADGENNIGLQGAAFKNSARAEEYLTLMQELSPERTEAFQRVMR